MKYWINSNSGDYVILDYRGQYQLNLIEIVVYYIDDSGKTSMDRTPYESHIITESQFKSLKGFVPIKRKNFFNRDMSKYRPTLKGGEKSDVPKRSEYKTKSESRNDRLKELGL